MWSKVWSGLGLLILPSIIAMPLSMADADGTMVRVLPVEGNYLVGEEIAVEVWVEDVANLYAADVRLEFDATRLEVLDADPSLPGVQVTPRDDLLSLDFVIHREADNEAGVISYAVTQINPSEPVSGTGALFSFTFQTLSTGLGLVSIQEYQLATRDADLIPAGTEGARYSMPGLFLPLVLASR